MATSKVQRWGIMTILIVTVVGTLGSFAVMVLSMQNQQRIQADYEKVNNEYQTQLKAYKAKVQAQSDELSAKYYDTFKQYSTQAGAYDVNSVKELKTEDLAEGNGAVIDGSTKFAAYYIGWDANGNVFDQSIDGSKLKEPTAVANGLDKAGLIAGWKEGLKGMKIGGVRLLSIPSDKAYGEAGQKDKNGKQTIPANMPLKFVVMAIPQPPTIPQPDSSKLMEAYMKVYGNQ